MIVKYGDKFPESPNTSRGVQYWFKQVLNRQILTDDLVIIPILDLRYSDFDLTQQDIKITSENAYIRKKVQNLRIEEKKKIGRLEPVTPFLRRRISPTGFVISAGGLEVFLGGGKSGVRY